MAGVARTGAAAPVQTTQAAPVVGTSQPMLGHDVQQFYLPVAAGSRKPGQELEYQPWLLGFAEVVFLIDKRTGSEHRVHVRLVARPPQAGRPVEWDKAYKIADEPGTKAEAPATWADVPDSIDTGKKLKAIEKAFGEFLYSGQKLSLYENRDLEQFVTDYWQHDAPPTSL